MNSFLQRYSLNGNWIDLIFLAVIIIFIMSSAGFVESLFELFGLLVSLFISFKFYSFFGKLFIDNFSFSHGIANAVGFFVAWFLSETIIYILTLVILSGFFTKIRSIPLNRTLRFIPSTVHAAVIYLFFISLIFSLPVKGMVKAEILQSRTGPLFIDLSQRLEKRIRNVFEGAVTESLNFLTIKPKSNESVPLGFTVSESNLFPDATSEKTMLDLVNSERSSRHLKKLEVDENLRIVARRYGKQLFTYGFFSHVSQVDGSTALERATREGIIFQIIGENLAFAPDVYLAHQGLMNSEGHRANILSIDYARVGIGVIDAGIYGRMFVQVFTD